MFKKNIGIEILDLLQNSESLVLVLWDFMFVRLELDKFIAVYLIALLHEAD